MQILNSLMSDVGKIVKAFSSYYTSRDDENECRTCFTIIGTSRAPAYTLSCRRSTEQFTNCPHLDLKSQVCLGGTDCYFSPQIVQQYDLF